MNESVPIEGIANKIYRVVFEALDHVPGSDKKSERQIGFLKYVNG